MKDLHHFHTISIQNQSYTTVMRQFSGGKMSGITMSGVSLNCQVGVV